MNLTLDPELAEFARTVDRALDEAGGLELARKAEDDPGAVYRHVGSLLAGLGIADFDPTADDEAMATATELCRIAGRHLLPYPLPEVLARAATDTNEHEGVVVVDSVHPRIAHLPALDRWLVMTVDGTGFAVQRSRRCGGVLSPLTWMAELAPTGIAPTQVAARWLTLDAAYTCGVLERARDLTVEHLEVRHQFGRPLKDFQSLKFRAVDMALAIAGVRELCYYGSWSLGSRSESAQTDALALRVAALDAARTVLRSAHQAHGAIGFTSEHDLSLVSRHVQGRLRSPWAYEASLALLTDAIAANGFDGLFSGEHARTWSAG